ncbi:putative proteasome subunit beta type-2 [Thamnocephalis sphaerospora]|uniref:Proteasome subunit beta n=1 Tax=Thamnocephalis sphaerospora TaxID=78915 RepID=A0A4P9XG51_9FUNG|nr:putative proteasome subunit beta type-2 [Thamnocephalis sphaerospora]|eukprot:RKP04603.1 putative proteasome subunit beta type-2 [Thamnocephalis sphaerospora]
MEFLLGITGRDFVLTLTDTTVARSITIMKSNEDKSRELTPTSLMLYSGESGDTVQFAEYIQANLRLERMRKQVDLSTNAVASFVRRQLAQSLRSRKPYQVNLLIAGADAHEKEGERARIYWIDYLSASARCPYACQGYGAYYCLSLLDRHHRADMTLEEVKELARLCVAEMRRRFVVNLGNFKCKIVSVDGIREEPLFDETTA